MGLHYIYLFKRLVKYAGALKTSSAAVIFGKLGNWSAGWI